MPDSVGSRLKRAWDVFRYGDESLPVRADLGPSYSRRPDHTRLKYTSERTIASAIFTRIALDVAAVAIKHVQLDENERYLSTIDSGLTKCLNVEANIDQTGAAFKQDIVMSMLDEGSVAIVPVEADIGTVSGRITNVRSFRTGKIVQWYPRHVKVEVYNDRSGLREEIILSKEVVAIMENPLYAVINDPNSTLKRLIQKLNLLDSIDARNGSGKLDLIIQLPYLVKSQLRREQAEKRRADIESQLVGSKYGIAYTDGTEKIIQLNRPVENNLMGQIEYLSTTLYAQLGLTQSIFDGTASDEVLSNYHARTVQPIVSAIADELHRTYLTERQRENYQAIRGYQNLFGFVPVSKIAEIADKFTRNEIMAPNEVRQIIGLTASDDPSANELRNRNLSIAKTGAGQEDLSQMAENNQNGGKSNET